MPLCNLWETSAPPKLLWVRCILWEDAVCCLAGAVGTTAPPKDCHATATRLPRYVKMPRNGWKMSWKIGWEIIPIIQISSSLYLSDMQHVARRLVDMIDIFVYSIIFIALQRLIQPILSSSRESPQPFPSHHTLLGTKKEIEYWHDVDSTSSRKY